jgi:hypothetical protein
MDKLGLILLPRSRLQQPSQVHFHLVEPHIEAVANSTQDMWGSVVQPKNLEIKLPLHCTSTKSIFFLLSRKKNLIKQRSKGIDQITAYQAENESETKRIEINGFQSAQ